MASLTEQVGELTSKATTLTQQQKELKKAKFPARTLKFQQEVIAKQPKTFAGRTEAIGKQFEKTRKTALSTVLGQRRKIQQYGKEALMTKGSIPEIESFKETLTPEQQKFVSERLTKIREEQQGRISEVEKKITKEEAQLQVELQRLEAAKDIGGEEEDIAYAKVAAQEEKISKLGQGKRYLQEGKFYTPEAIEQYASAAEAASLQQDLISIEDRFAPKITMWKVSPTQITPGKSYTKYRGKPLQVGLPESDISLWKEQVDYRGYVSGSLSFLKEKIESSLFESQLKRISDDKNYEAYQLKPTQRLLSETTLGAIHVGTRGVLIGVEGIEEFFSKHGKEKRKRFQTKWTGKEVLGYEISPSQSKVLSYTGSVGKIGLAFVGSGLYSKTKGYVRTAGRTELELSRVVPKDVLYGGKTFPELPRSQQLQSFKQSPYRLPSTESGAFHATDVQFWGKNLKPLPGSSELPGLYGSYGVSPHFLRVSATERLSFIDYLIGGKIGSKPGIAYLQPKGFRYSPYKKVPGGYDWINPPKPGYADVPLMKTEAEAIFRPGAGVYTKTQGRYFIKYKGQRVPIDEFKYSGLSENLVPKDSRLFKSSEYNLPSSKRYIEQDIPLLLSSASSKKTTKIKSYKPTSISPLTPSRSLISYPSKTSLITSPNKKRTSQKPRSLKRYTSESYLSEPKITSYPKKSYDPKNYYPSYAEKRKKKPTKLIKPPRIKQKRRKPIKRTKLIRQPTQYTPSFTGAFLGIRSKKKPKKIAGGYLFGIRPIIDVGFKRKKRKK